MTRFMIIAATALASAGLSSTVTASTINLSTDPGQVYVSELGMGSSSVNGASLAGMFVDVEYADGGSETLTWAPTLRPNGLPSSSEGAATSADFSLSLGWSSFSLTTTRLLSSMSFSVLDLGSVFDIYPVDAFDTPGSLRGVAFRVDSGDQDGEIDVSFTNQVLVRGHMIGNDLFTNMAVDFSGLAARGFLGSMSFVTDLDFLAVADDLTELKPVPPPAGLPLLLGGLGIMGLMRRRTEARIPPVPLA